LREYPTIVVHAIYEAVKSMGAADVRIAEGSRPNRRTTMDLAESAGYLTTVPKFEDSFVDLNLDDVVAEEPSTAPFSKAPRDLSAPTRLWPPTSVISVPKMKNAPLGGAATLFHEELLRCVVPRRGLWAGPKNVLHWAGPSMSGIVDSTYAVPPGTFTIVDGNYRHGGQRPHTGHAQARRRSP